MSNHHYLPPTCPRVSLPHLPLDFVSCVIFVLVVVDNPVSPVGTSHVCVSDLLADMSPKENDSASLRNHHLSCYDKFMMSLALCKALCFLSLTFWASVSFCLRTLLLTCECITQPQLLLRSAHLEEVNKVSCIYNSFSFLSLLLLSHPLPNVPKLLKTSFSPFIFACISQIVTID